MLFVVLEILTTRPVLSVGWSKATASCLAADSANSSSNGGVGCCSTAATSGALSLDDSWTFSTASVTIGTGLALFLENDAFTGTCTMGAEGGGDARDEAMESERLAGAER